MKIKCHVANLYCLVINVRLQLGNLAYTPQISNLFRLTSWVLDFVIIMAFTIAPLGMDMTHTNKRTSFPAKYDFF